MSATRTPRTRRAPAVHATPAISETDAVPAPGLPLHAEPRSLLRPLGIVGYGDVEPAMLAALATGEPLLLVSDHGAAKTLLLIRLAEALGVELRHYNASILQFDDLAGFPIPDERGAIRYAAPPGAIWGAEAVFFDEIGRCRPETANKLFPIIHERRIQGIALERLRYRWAATNPPVEALSADRLDDPYEGVAPLDPALADRFSYIVSLPRFADLSDQDRIEVIRGVGERPEPDSAVRVREMVRATRDLIESPDPEMEEAIVAYVLALAAALWEAGISVGGRRAATFRRNLIAVRAACIVLGRSDSEKSFLAALLSSIPEVARRPVPRSVLISAHGAAWRHVSLPENDPRRLLEGVRDHVRRVTLAMTLPGLSIHYRGEAITSALSAMKAGDAEIVAWLILPRLLRRRIAPATAVETIAEIVSNVAVGGHSVTGWGRGMDWITRVRSAIADTGLPGDSAQYLCSVIFRHSQPSSTLSGYEQDDSWRVPVDRCLEIWRACAAGLGGSEVAGGSPDGEEVVA